MNIKQNLQTCSSKQKKPSKQNVFKANVLQNNFLRFFLYLFFKTCYSTPFINVLHFVFESQQQCHSQLFWNPSALWENIWILEIYIFVLYIENDAIILCIWGLWTTLTVTRARPLKTIVLFWAVALARDRSKQLLYCFEQCSRLALWCAGDLVVS